MPRKQTLINVAIILTLAVLIQLATPMVYLNGLVLIGLIILPLGIGLRLQIKFFGREAYTPEEKKRFYRMGGGLVAFAVIWLVAAILVLANRESASTITMDTWYLFPGIGTLVAGATFVYMARISPPPIRTVTQPKTD